MRTLLTAVIAGVALAALVTAQQARTGGAPPYDVANEKVIDAVVVGLDATEPVPGRRVEFLAVTVGGSPVKVFLGPPEWMKTQHFAFPKGAKAQIHGLTGYRLNGDAIMPRTITIGGKTLTLRDSDGNPVWDGR